ncbi:CCA tRNA nucleotidyltransferase [Sulfuricurvum sp.]|uniref:CCA tRNA nucleotidyltransferase n=1 Tax=Sulfuricurvum sp. TaxID=2025608 RepID=UPI003567FB5A
MIPFPTAVSPLIDALKDHNIIPIIVGGYVRDALIAHPTHDMDIELYGLTSLEELEVILKPFGKLNAVGKSFGVLKLSYQGLTIDFSPPRIESKHGAGHKGFEIEWFSDIDFARAARRRDFTINAIGYNPLTKTLLDPYGGIEDLKNKRLVCVDNNTFVEDPLRVLRAVQFVARFELTCDENLLRLCRDMILAGALNELPKERIFEELKKLLLLSNRPSLGLNLLKEMGGLSFFSPLEKLETTPQDPVSHPEGSVWTHTLMCVDEMAHMRTKENKRDIVLMLAALLHDIAKPFTTIVIEGVLNAPHHAEKGIEIARQWLMHITDDKSLIEGILPLVRYHGTPRKLYRNRASDSDILHLSTHVCIKDLLLISRADFFGRLFVSALPEKHDAGAWLYERASALNVLHAPPPPLLMGRDLIALGLTPSTRFKTLLDGAYEAQLNQEFTTSEQAKAWLVTQL